MLSPIPFPDAYAQDVLEALPVEYIPMKTAWNNIPGLMLITRTLSCRADELDETALLMKRYYISNGTLNELLEMPLYVCYSTFSKLFYIHYIGKKVENPQICRFRNLQFCILLFIFC